MESEDETSDLNTHERDKDQIQAGEARKSPADIISGHDLSSSSKSQHRETLNEFFIDGKSIHRKVLEDTTNHIPGSGAYSRPNTYNVRNAPAAKFLAFDWINNQGVPGYTVVAKRTFTSISNVLTEIVISSSDL